MFVKLVISSLLIWVHLAIAASPDSSRLPQPDEVLDTLQPEHPRLFLSQQRIDELRAQSQDDEMLSRLVEALLNQADAILEEPPADYIVIGPRLLSQSRLVLERVATLGLAFHLIDNELYARRAKRELFAAAAFPDWNPSHFLDTAEMSNAFGIGYDWLYHELDDFDRSVIRGALIEKGLQVGRDAFENDTAWWSRVDHNWNQVCNGGLTVGALAVADDAPELCRELLSLTLAHVPRAMLSYAPDGGWNEGPGYWGYATRYTVYMLAALNTALGTDFGISEAPGFSECSLFPMYGAGPTDLYFNFADAGTHYGPKSSYFWLGRQFDMPVSINENHRLLQKALDQGRDIDPFAVLWYSPPVESLPKPPLNAYYRGVDAVFLRTEWNDPHAWFVGFKGGDNQANHAHLDIGSFVLDALGTRWVVDLGRDNYNLPGYWDEEEGGSRWHYFRLNNFSHNTLTLNQDLQRVRAKAPIVDFDLTAGDAFAIADLTQAYQPHAEHVWRGVALHDSAIVIQDEIMWSGSSKQVLWNITTNAEILPDKRTARLEKAGKTLYATIVIPHDAVFDIASAQQPPPERQNEEFQRLVISYEEPGEETRIVVVFSKQPSEIKVKALNNW